MKTNAKSTQRHSIATLTVTVTLFFFFLCSSFVYCEVFTNVTRAIPVLNEKTAAGAEPKHHQQQSNGSFNKVIRDKVIVNLSTTPAGCRAIELINIF
jgi:hypothetical protein